MNTCPEKKPDGSKCGEPSFPAVGNSLCEKHYSFRYPTTYNRLKREIKCEGCLGTGWVVDKDEQRVVHEKCNGRGVIDPLRENGNG